MLFLKKWLRQCVEILHIPLIVDTGESLPETPYIQIVEAFSPEYYFGYSREGFLTISCKENCERWCEETPPKVADSLGIYEVASCVKGKLQVDMTSAIGGYNYAFAYIDNRVMLNEKVGEIKDFPPLQADKKFHIPTTYEDALVRFTFIDEIMILFKKHYTWLFLVFLSVLIFVQVGIVITHRKHNYGIYLSKGIKLLTIYRIVLLQVTLSFLVASFLVTPLIINVLQPLLADGVQKIITAKVYVNHISATSLDLLPISIWSYLVIAFIFLVVLYLTTISLLHWTIAKEHFEPAHLL